MITNAYLLSYNITDVPLVFMFNILFTTLFITLGVTLLIYSIMLLYLFIVSFSYFLIKFY